MRSEDLAVADRAEFVRFTLLSVVLLATLSSIGTAASAQGDAARGKSFFQTACSACHSIAPGPKRRGPDAGRRHRPQGGDRTRIHVHACIDRIGPDLGSEVPGRVSDRPREESARHRDGCLRSVGERPGGLVGVCHDPEGAHSWARSDPSTHTHIQAGARHGADASRARCGGHQPARLALCHQRLCGTALRRPRPDQRQECIADASPLHLPFIDRYPGADDPHRVSGGDVSDAGPRHCRDRRENLPREVDL